MVAATLLWVSWASGGNSAVPCTSLASYPSGMPVGVEWSQPARRPTAPTTAGSAAKAASAGVALDRAPRSACRICGTKNAASTSTVSAWMRRMSRSDSFLPRASCSRMSWSIRPPDAVVAGVEVVDAAAGTELVQRVVVQVGADRVVVGVDHEAGARVDGPWHLARGEDLVGDRLPGLALADREPLVAAGAVAHEERRQAVDGAGLQVLAQGQLARREVGDVAVDVGVDEVLAAHVEVLQAPAEVAQVPGVVPDEEGVGLPGRAEPGVLHAEGGARRLVELDDRAVVAARHDQGGGRDRAAWRDHGDVVGPARPRVVLAEHLGVGDDRLQPALVQGCQAARRRRVGADLLEVGVGHVQGVHGRAPGDEAVVADDDPGRAREA